MTAPKLRPILFSAAMVRAILADKKTQTRRVVKHVDGDSIRLTDGQYVPLPTCDRVINCHWTGPNSLYQLCPYGQPGDRLWVRENWKASSAHDGLAPCAIPPGDTVEYGSDAERVLTGRLRPSIHMPRWASRITLEIVSQVRVERLQDISEVDARAEGFASREEFFALWDSINGKRTGCAVADNPWVWVVEFKRVTP